VTADTDASTDTGTECLNDAINYLDSGALYVPEFNRAMMLVGDMPVDEILGLRPIEFARHIFQAQQDASQDSSSSTKRNRKALTHKQCVKIALQFIKSLNELYTTPANNTSDAASTHGSTRDVRLVLNVPVDEATLNQILLLLNGGPTQ